MKYADARSQIRTGDALFFSGGNWKSWYGIQIMLVRMFKPSKWSHVGMAWAENGRVFIMESVGSGIRLNPLSNDMPCGWVSRPQPLTEDAVQWAFKRIGAKYPQKWKMVLNKAFGMKVDLAGRMDCSDYFLHINAADGLLMECVSDPTSICDYVMDEWGSLTSVEAE